MRRLLYVALRAVSAVDYRLKERLTLAGWLVLGVAAAAAAAGLDTNLTVTYRAFTFLAALLLLSWLASLFFRARTEASRDMPRYATAGAPFSYRVTLVNRGRRPLAGAQVAEHFRDPRPAFEDWRRAREPGEKRRNWFDRNVGYFRWRWLIEHKLPRDAEAAPLAPLAPGEQRTLQLSFTPRRRGRIEMAGLTLGRTDPLGLVRGLARVTLPARLIALPRRYRLPELALPGRRKFQPGGVSLAASVGDSEEFLALRDYRPGDPLQRVHWKSFARTGKPVVKEYQDEFFERHALVLDTGSSAGEDAAFEDAVALAASFVYTIDTHDCLLDLLFVGGEVRAYTAGRGQMHAEQMLEALAGVGPSAPADFTALAQAVLARRDTLSSVIAVLLGWDEARAKFVATLRAEGYEVRVLLVAQDAAQVPPGVLQLTPGRIEEGLGEAAMIAPPFFIGATLLFWGWQTGHPVVGALLAVALEAARHLKFRLQLGTDEHSNIADLSTIGFVTLAVLLAATRGLSRGILEAFIWVPAALAPILVAQLLTEGRRIPLSALFRYMRKLLRRHPEIQDPPVDASMVYAALALLAAGVAYTRGPGYYAGIVIATACALYAARPAHAPRLGLAALMVTVAAGLGVAGQRGLEQLQAQMESWVGDLYLRNFDADPYRSVTEIGSIGRLKQYDAILMRVYAKEEDSERVKLLHRSSYTSYVGTSWLAREAQMQTIDSRADNTTWDLAEGAPDWRTRIVARIERGKSLLALPADTVRISNLTAVTARHNGLGALHVETGVEWVQYEPETARGIADYAPPGAIDTAVPNAEREAFERVAAELTLKEVAPAEAVRRVQRYLAGFSYTLFREQAPPPGQTALADFLTRTRAGHCEYFAAATTLLLRAGGVPARYATGFAVTEYSRLEGAFVVRSRHGHAWTRAWVGDRWVDLDFTPPDWVIEEAREAPYWQGLADVARWLGFRWTMREEFKMNDAWFGVLAVLALVLGWRLFGHKRVEQKATAAIERARYPGEDSEFYAVEKSVPLRQPSETQAAWLARIAPTLPSKRLDPIREALRLHQRYRFDPAGLSRNERNRLRELCRSLAPQT